MLLEHLKGVIMFFINIVRASHEPDVNIHATGFILKPYVFHLEYCVLF